MVARFAVSSSESIVACAGGRAGRTTISLQSVVVLRGPARGPPRPAVRRIEGWMQARDPKRDRSAGSVGRPAFGIGPIARVSRPSGDDRSAPPPMQDRRDHAAAASAGTFRLPPPLPHLPGLLRLTGVPVAPPYAAMPPT